MLGHESGVITMLRAGYCTIDANQAGNATLHRPRPQVSQAFTIAKGNQTITFGALDRPSLGRLADHRLRPRPRPGLTVAFASNSPAVCTVSGTTVTLVGIGHLLDHRQPGRRRRLERGCADRHADLRGRRWPRPTTVVTCPASVVYHGSRQDAVHRPSVTGAGGLSLTTSPPIYSAPTPDVGTATASYTFAG